MARWILAEKIWSHQGVHHYAQSGYEGPIEEWDIVIYDQLESPVLYVNNLPDPVRAIPVEHVRGVVEVKSTFRRDMTRKFEKKSRNSVLSLVRTLPKITRSISQGHWCAPHFSSKRMFVITMTFAPP